MIGISTSWKSNELEKGEALFNAVRRLDFLQVELEYRITHSMYLELKNLLKKSPIQVVSIHNFFPHPSDMPRSLASGDLFLLSHPEKEERNEAVKRTITCIECADDLEAGVVVLHCGRIEMDPQLETLFDFLQKGLSDSDEAQEFIRGKLNEREEKKPKYIDALFFSLERLLKEAEKKNVCLALENRAHYHELPGPDDFALFFEEFDGSPLRYWHDVGHAQVNENLGIWKQEELLEKCGDRMIGIHLHDVDGKEDHLVPGKGKVDFRWIKSKLNEKAVCILELKPGTPDEEIPEGLRHLHENGFSLA